MTMTIENSNNNNNCDSSSLNRIMNESSCDQQTQQTNHVQFSLSPLSLPLQSSLLQQSSRSMSQPTIITSNNHYRCPHRERIRRHRMMMVPTTTTTTTNATTSIMSIPVTTTTTTNINDQQQSYQQQTTTNVNRLAWYRTKIWLQYFITIAIRFIPILISTIGIICLLAFLINYEFALIIFNITLMIILAIIIFFIVYTFIMFYIYRDHSFRQQQQQQRRQRQRQQQNRNQQQQQRNRSYSHHHNHHNQNVNDFSIITTNDYHDDDENECYNCRMERLNATDIPPPYDSPPKYEELNVDNLIMANNNNNHNHNANNHNDNDHVTVQSEQKKLEEKQPEQQQ